MPPETKPSAMERGGNFFTKLTEDSEQQTAIRFAFYNTLFFLLLAVCFAGLFAVYQMLHLFLLPIIWAVLVGTVMFPMKRAIGSVLNGWLKRLDESDTPLLIGLTLLPVNGVTGTSRFLFQTLVSAHGIYYILAYVVLKVLSFNGTLVSLLGLGGRVYSWCDSVLNFITQQWVFPLILLYSVAYAAWIYIQDPNELHGKKKFARTLSLPIWLFVLSYTSSYCGLFRVVVFTLSSVVLALISLGVIRSSSMPPVEEIEKKLEDDHPTAEHPVDAAVEALKTDEEARATALAAPATPSTTGDNYVQVMFLICLLLWTAKHDSVLVVIISLVLLAAGLSLVDRLDVWQKLLTTYRESTTRDYVNRISHITIPGPLRQFFKILFTSDKYLIVLLKKKVDFISSVSVMATIAFGSIFFLIFTAFSLHGETVHLAKLTTNVLSSNPEWLKTVSNFTEEQLNEKEIDNYVEQAYQQSRTWLASNIRSLADPKDTKRADQLEEQAKALVDNLYHLWEERSHMFNNASTTAVVPKGGDLFGQLMSVTNLETLKGEIVAVVKDNIDSVISIAQSLWKVIALNISVLYTIAWSVLGFVLGFGFELLSFVVEIIVFLTVVYYLLASSNEQWLPLRWVSDITPAIQASESRYSIATAIESAISSVFVLSAKMSIFYGLYTYFVTTVFDLNILYAVRGETAATVVFILVSIAPLFFADVTFYSEVKNSHPYVTGLAVLGGVNCFGLQGAIFGPIILCCLIVAVNVYAEFAKKR
ncbi:hypothetical protein M3Y99_00337300 [Aphelenchoides fujianensis]|nr:hypothetical protein M3Y99_00337300 [Aphelenchoides fujianensis]